MSKNILTKSKMLTKFRATFRQKSLAFLMLTRVESVKHGHRGNVHIPIEK